MAVTHFEVRLPGPNQTLARGPEFIHPILAPASDCLNVRQSGLFR